MVPPKSRATSFVSSAGANSALPSLQRRRLGEKRIDLQPSFGHSASSESSQSGFSRPTERDEVTELMLSLRSLGLDNSADSLWALSSF